MKRLAVVLFSMFVCSFTAQAFAKPATQTQRMELMQLVDEGVINAVEAEKILSTYRHYEPAGCTKVEVNYSLTLQDMAAQHNWSEKYVEDHLNFHLKPRYPEEKGKVTKEFCWYRFHMPQTAAEVQGKIHARGQFKVANLWELIAFATVESELPNRAIVMGLASREHCGTHGGFKAPIFHSFDGRKIVSFAWDSQAKSPATYYLAVRK